MSEETISLRELVEQLWEGKAIIIFSIITSVLIATILSLFVIEEKYESKAIVQVTSETSTEGIVQQYIASEFTPQVFSERIQSQAFIDQVFNQSGERLILREQINVNIEPTTNMITVKYTSTDAVKANEELNKLILTLKKSMSESLKSEFAILAETYTSQNNKYSEEISELIKEYNGIVESNNLPRVLILQSMVSNQLIINLSSEQQETMVNIDGLLQNKLVQLQTKITSKSTEYRKVLDQYHSVKTSIDSFRPEPLIKNIVEPTAPRSASSPNILLSIAISLTLGLMIGVFLVFLRNYWNETNPDKV